MRGSPPHATLGGLEPSPLDDTLSRALAGRAEQSLLRRRVVTTQLDSVHVERLGRRLINFSSNDYLGLAHHPRMLAAMADVTATGSGAAGLISGFAPVHADAEQAIAVWKKTAAALLMPSGYQANTAVVQTLAAAGEAAGKPVRFLVDKLAHASIIDALRGRPFRVFPHNGLAKLERLLADSPPGELQVVLTESIFSMDGDTADLEGLAALKKQYDFVLVLDDAHASGVYGAAGAGLADELGLGGSVDVSVVTLSKALGASGGAICGSAAFISAVENFGRAFVYSTAIPPATARLVREAIAICREEPDRARRVRRLATRLRETLVAVGVAVAPGDSPIVPVILGDAGRTLRVACALQDAGFLVVAVRPPTVPPGASRLRVTVSSEHSDEDVDRLSAAIAAASEANP